MRVAALRQKKEIVEMTHKKSHPSSMPETKLSFNAVRDSWKDARAWITLGISKGSDYKQLLELLNLIENQIDDKTILFASTSLDTVYIDTRNGYEANTDYIHIWQEYDEIIIEYWKHAIGKTFSTKLRDSIDNIYLIIKPLIRQLVESD